MTDSYVQVQPPYYYNKKKPIKEEETALYMLAYLTLIEG